MRKVRRIKDALSDGAKTDAYGKNKQVDELVAWGKVAIGCGMLLGQEVYEEEGYLFIKQEFCEELVKRILSYDGLALIDRDRLDANLKLLTNLNAKPEYIQVIRDYVIPLAEALAEEVGK